MGNGGARFGQERRIRGVTKRMVWYAASNVIIVLSVEQTKNDGVTLLCQSRNNTQNNKS